MAAELMPGRRLEPSKPTPKWESVTVASCKSFAPALSAGYTAKAVYFVMFGRLHWVAVNPLW
jgi:hypothetical protein